MAQLSLFTWMFYLPLRLGRVQRAMCALMGPRAMGRLSIRQRSKRRSMACENGGTVLLQNGTFLSGLVTLKSKLEFRIDSSATLLGSQDIADYSGSQDTDAKLAGEVVQKSAPLCSAGGPPGHRWQRHGQRQQQPGLDGP